MFLSADEWNSLRFGLVSHDDNWTTWPRCPTGLTQFTLFRTTIAREQNRTRDIFFQIEGTYEIRFFTNTFFCPSTDKNTEDDARTQEGGTQNPRAGYKNTAHSSW